MCIRDRFEPTPYCYTLTLTLTLTFDLSAPKLCHCWISEVKVILYTKERGGKEKGREERRGEGIGPLSEILKTSLPPRAQSQPVLYGTEY